MSSSITISNLTKRRFYKPSFLCVGGACLSVIVDEDALLKRITYRYDEAIRLPVEDFSTRRTTGRRHIRPN